MTLVLAKFLLILHFIWATWMVAGIVLAVAGFRWHRLWRWKIFRISHLAGLLVTGTVPLWAGGVCPLTEWEWQLRQASGSQTSSGSESFTLHWIREVLFIDLDPMILSMAAALGALLTLVIFISRPPWRT